MSESLVVFVAILVFTGGLAIGYVAGWGDGVERGFGTGWSAAMQEVRRIIAKTRGVT